MYFVRFSHTNGKAVSFTLEHHQLQHMIDCSWYDEIHNCFRHKCGMFHFIVE